MSDGGKALFTLGDLAKRYGTSPETISGWVRRGELKAVNIARSANAKKPRYRITLEAVEAFEAARSAMPTASARRPRRRRSGEPVIDFYKS